jgi:hypothetical protein
LGQDQSENKIGIAEKEFSLIAGKFYQHIFRGLGQPRSYPDLRSGTHALLFYVQQFLEKSTVDRSDL